MQRKSLVLAHMIKIDAEKIHNPPSWPKSAYTPSPPQTPSLSPLPFHPQPLFPAPPLLTLLYLSSSYCWLAPQTPNFPSNHHQSNSKYLRFQTCIMLVVTIPRTPPPWPYSDGGDFCRRSWQEVGEEMKGSISDTHLRPHPPPLNLLGVVGYFHSKRVQSNALSKFGHKSASNSIKQMPSIASILHWYALILLKRQLGVTLVTSMGWVKISKCSLPVNL